MSFLQVLRIRGVEVEVRTSEAKPPNTCITCGLVLTAANAGNLLLLYCKQDDPAGSYYP